MAVPYAPHGILSKAIRWIRKQANEPLDVKYTDEEILEFLSQELDNVLEDVYGESAAPPYAQFPIVLVTDQERYVLPPNIKEVHRYAKLDTTTGLVEWEFIPGSRQDPTGPTVVLEGSSVVRFIPAPNDWAGQTITLDYIPGGVMPLHQNVSPVYDTDNDAGTQILTASSFSLFETNTTWRLGTYDRRPNAYVGEMLRILGTVTDTAPSSPAYEFFPVQERQILTYDITTQAVTFEPNIDFDPANCDDKQVLVGAVDTLGRTYLLYEVVPDVDEGVFWLAALEAAISIAAAEKRDGTVKILVERRIGRKRGILSRWSNKEMRTGVHHDSTLDYWTDDGMS